MSVPWLISSESTTKFSPEARSLGVLVRQAAVVMISLFPFSVSSVAAFALWTSTAGLPDVWRLSIVTLTWVVVFAAGTFAFWKVVGRLALV